MHFKRWALFVCCFLFLFGAVHGVADASLEGYSEENGYHYVLWGQFPQTADGQDQPILWRILDASDSEAYLLSEYILFNNRIHPDDEAYIAFGGAFNQTEMYQLLNGSFDRIVVSQEEEEHLRRRTYWGYAYMAEQSFLEQAFTESERSHMISDESRGVVFLPSAEDLQNAQYGFSSNASRQAHGTPYALECTGLFQYMNGSSPYWTMSQSQSFDYGTRCTKEVGKLGYIRCVVMNEGCRPAIRLSLQNITISEGDGSHDNPYKLVP